MAASQLLTVFTLTLIGLKIFETVEKRGPALSKVGAPNARYASPASRRNASASPSSSAC